MRNKQKINFYNEPFQHLVISNFLDNKHFNQLKEQILKQRFEFKDSDLFSMYQTGELTNSNNRQINKFLNKLRSDEFQEVIRSNFKINSTKIDSAAQIYQNTNYLLPHDDRLEGRKLAYIFYFSSLSKKEGGALELFNTNKKNQPNSINKSIQPKENTLVLFKVGKKSFHQVAEITSQDNQRISITGWFYD